MVTRDLHVVEQLRPLPTLIELLIDETGSMGTYLSSTIGGFNNFIDEQRAQDGTLLVTLTKFASNRKTTPYVDLEVGMVPHLTNTTFLPQGGTNLYDAIVSRIADLSDRLTTWDVRPNILFVVMTDGEDNASKTTALECRDAVLNASNSSEWTFVYLGAHENALHIALDLGFVEGNIKPFWGHTMEQTMHDVSAATTAFRTTAISTQTFFADAARTISCN